MIEDSDIHCKDCERRPDQIDEYILAAKEYDITPVEYVKIEEGTYNWLTGHFYCTECYLKRGMPLGTA